MKIKDISYPTTLDKIEDITDDNIDVFIDINDGTEYVVVVITPKNYYTLMNKEKVNNIEPGPPEIIVKELTEENIKDAVTSYLDDEAYWLKVNFLCNIKEKAFDINLMNSMLNEKKISIDKVIKMEIINITYPINFDKIKDISDDNIDVIIELNDGYEYVVKVSTPKNFYTLMNKERLNYIKPGSQVIIVNELTEENIKDAVTAHLEDEAYWLKVMHLTNKSDKTFDIELMNSMLDDIKRINEEIFGANT